MTILFSLVVEGIGVATAETAVNSGALTLANNGIKQFAFTVEALSVDGLSYLFVSVIALWDQIMMFIGGGLDELLKRRRLVTRDLVLASTFCFFPSGRATVVS